MLRDLEAMHWLTERTPDPNWGCGYDARRWEATAWILNAMYEDPSLPADVTYDEAEKAPAAPGPEPRTRRWWARRKEPPSSGELLGTATGVALGRSQSPGPGWRRLRWSELGERLGVDPLAKGTPNIVSLPMWSWPLSIAPPAEGSLDREQFEALVGHLVERSPAGPDEPCFAFYDSLLSYDMATPRLFDGRLSELIGLYDDEQVPGSPSNVWSHDRSWLIYTDWDLWATKVSGDGGLIAALEGDSLLETVRLPF